MVKFSFILKKFIAPVILIVISGCIALGQAAFVPADTEIRKTDVSSVSFEGVEMKYELHVSNPQDYEATLRRISWEMTIGDAVVFSNDSEPYQTLTYKQATTVDQKIDLRWTDIFGTTIRTHMLGNLPFTLTAEIETVPASENVLLPEGAEFLIATSTKSGVFPMVSRPVIAIDTLALKSFNLAIAHLELRVRFKNPNPWPATFTDTELVVMVDNDIWLKRTIRTDFMVPERSDIVMDIPFTMRPRDFSTQVYRKLNMSQEFDFSLTGNTSVAIFSDGFTISDEIEIQDSQSQRF